MLRSRRLPGCALAGVILLAPAAPTIATPVTFSGTIVYSGSYSGDSMYVAAFDTAGSVVRGLDAVAAGSPPFARPFSILFDNASASGPLVVVALLDVDGSGFDPDFAGESVTDADILGWYPGTAAPGLVDPSTSRTGLDFALPTGEIHGTVILDTGQAWAEVEAYTTADLWSLRSVERTTSGPYALRGVYAGSYWVIAWAPFGEICYGDVTCAAPSTLVLTAGEVLGGIDLDFTGLPVVPESWGRIKSLYR